MDETPQRYLRKSLANSVINSPLDPRIAALRHDDEAERQKRRSGALLQGRIANISSSDIESPPMGEDEAKKHFHFCTQLCLQGKINSKNAWKLQLFNFIGATIKKNESESFEMAGTSLEVGAMVYSVKVDDVHDVGIKLASAIDRHTQEFNDNGENDGMDEGINESVPGGEKKRRKRAPRSTLFTDEDGLFDAIEKEKPVNCQFKDNPKKNTMENLFTFIYPQHAHVHSFRMNNMEKWWTSDEEEDLTLKLKDKLDFAIPSLNNFKICHPFADFSLDEWDPNEEERRLSHLSQAKDSEVFFDNNADQIHELDGSIHDFNNDNEINGTDDEQENAQPSQADQVSTIGNNIADISIDKSQRTIGTEYSYCHVLGLNNKNNFITRLWAGPSHWKMSLTRKKPLRFTGSLLEKHEKPKLGRKKRPREPPTFNQKVNLDFKDTLQVKRNPPSYSAEKLLLPILLETSIKDLKHDLFLKPGVYPQSTNIKLEVRDDLNASTYKYDNPNDSLYCTINNDNGGYDNDDNEIENEEIAVAGQREAFNDENLIDVPDLPNTDECIKYAIRAKKMDISKLKSSVWAIITKNKEINMTFLEMYKQVPNYLNDEMKKELTKHYVFGALLHLCNEHNLVLKQIPNNKKDFQILSSM